MRIGSFLASEGPSWGLVEDERIIDAPRLLAAAGYAPTTDVRTFLAGGGTAEQLALAVRRGIPKNAVYPRSAVRLRAPLPNPSKIVCIGLNFEDYRQLLGLEYLPVPQLFLKAPSAVVGPDDPVEIPEGYGTVFHEFEVGAVIGRRTKGATAAQAEEAIFGYTIFNDLVLHDIELLSREYQQWAKNCDTFAPMGPWITTAEEFPVHGARMVRRRNGRVEAESSTKRMRRQFPELIRFVSTFMTLEPGDLVTSASPPAGPFAPGDVIEVEVEGIGVLRNPVVSGCVDRQYAQALGL